MAVREGLAALVVEELEELLDRQLTQQYMAVLVELVEQEVD